MMDYRKGSDKSATSDMMQKLLELMECRTETKITKVGSRFEAIRKRMVENFGKHKKSKFTRKRLLKLEITLQKELGNLMMKCFCRYCKKFSVIT